MSRRCAPATPQFAALLLCLAPWASQVFAQPANPPAQPAPGGPYEQKAEVVKSVNPGEPATGEGGPASSPFVVQPGFQVELIYTVPRPQLGSWVCMTVDPKGRIIASDQNARGLCRVTPAPLGSDKPTIVEHLDLDINSVQGMLFAFDSLYCNVNSAQNGLYRFKYDPQTDKFGPKETLKRFGGTPGEHGPHALRLSPDGKSIYVLCGNHTLPPVDRVTSAPPQTMGGIRKEPMTAAFKPGHSSRLPANYDEDLMLTRQWDPTGHARGILAPGGWVAKTDPDGVTWEILTAGMRNTYDMALNSEGEIFLYDADMEFDMGSPWYRPTRLMHGTSGSEFGWRSGSGKWPEYYADSLPSVLGIGPGSPVGVTFGHGAKFPAKYQRAIYCADWTFGTMYAVHLTPDGASYKGVKEEFLGRNALPLTDVIIGSDGHMYFTIGGRNTDSFMYRVSYKGAESTAQVPVVDPQFADMRKLRRQIESTHMNGTAQTGEHYQDALNGAGGPAARVAYLLPFLSHADRHIRFAARVGLESMAVADWKAEALKVTDPVAKIEVAMALARQGVQDDRAAVLGLLAGIDRPKLSETQLLAWLRATQLVLIRLGEFDEATRENWVGLLDPMYPNASKWVNREVVQLLIALKSPSVVDKTVALLAKPTGDTYGEVDELIARNQQYQRTVRAVSANHPDEERVHLYFMLRNATVGWNLENMTKYYGFLETAQGWSGGAAYRNYLRNADTEAFANLPENARLLVTANNLRQVYVAPELPKPKGPEKNWTIEEVRELAKTKLKDRDFDNGVTTYAAAKCVVCHRFGDDGGATGPDLTNLSRRFSIESLTEAIFEPSKAISDQYRAHMIQTTGGKVINGRVVNEMGDRLTVIVDPEDPTKLVELKKSEVDQMKPSDVSLMPKELLKPLGEEEVLDLVAYLMSQGDATNAMFKQPPPGQRRGRAGARRGGGDRGGFGRGGAGGAGRRGGARDGAPGGARDGAPGGARDGAPGGARDGAPGGARDGAPGGAGAPGGGGAAGGADGNAPPARGPAAGGQ